MDARAIRRAASTSAVLAACGLAVAIGTSPLPSTETAGVDRADQEQRLTVREARAANRLARAERRLRRAAAETGASGATPAPAPVVAIAPAPAPPVTRSASS